MYTKEIYGFSPNLGNISRNGSSCSLGDVFRPATSDEKNEIITKIKSIGKDWDANNKKIIDYKWRAEKGETYWQSFCNANNGDTEYKPHTSTENRNKFDDAIYAQGDYHKTKEDCQRFCDALNSVIKNFK